jgi:hypothetical protein
VSSDEISGGFLNRHLIIRGGSRPALREREDGSWKLPDRLRDELKEMYRPPSGLKGILEKSMDEEDDNENIDDEPFDPEIKMAWGSGAKEIWFDIDAELLKETDPLRIDLFARVGEMTVRLATIVAFGRGSRTVDKVDMEWARALVKESTEGLHRDVLKYSINMQDFPGLCQRILELAYANFAKTKDRFIKRRLISRGCTNFLKKGADLKAALDHLVAAERLEFACRPAKGDKGGRSSDGYVLLEDDDD